MPLDDVLIKSVSSATEEMGQPAAVAKRLIAWLEAMSTSELTAEGESQFLENTRRAIQVRTFGEES
jgi:hypothetical protein